MIQKIPASDNDPLILVHKTKGLVPLTDSVARKHIKDVCRLLNLQNPVTFHDFRRGGVSWAFQNGVPLEQIMKHGTWKSDAVWSYLPAPTLHSPVSLSFRSTLLVPTWCLGVIFPSFLNLKQLNTHNLQSLCHSP